MTQVATDIEKLSARLEPREDVCVGRESGNIGYKEGANSSTWIWPNFPCFLALPKFSTTFVGEMLYHTME